MNDASCTQYASAQNHRWLFVDTGPDIASKVGLDVARGDLLPKDKQKNAESLIAQSGAVGIVRDCINDAPAFARADNGFFMGVVGTGPSLPENH